MVHVVLGAGAASVAAFLIAPPGSVWAMIAWFLPLVCATLLLTARTMTSQSPARSPLRLLLTGQLVYLLASAVWYVAPVELNYRLPFPSPLDAAYFAAYGIYALFLGILLRRHLRNSGVEDRLAFIDSLILTTSMCAILWVWVIEPQLDQGLSALPTAVAVLYPGFNLLLFALAARLAISARLDRSLPGLCMFVWIGAEVAGDIFYGFQSANGLFRHEGPLMVTWMAAYTALGALAAHPGVVTLLGAEPGGPPPATSLRRPVPGVGRTVRLAALLVAALVPLALGLLHERGSTALIVASAVTFALVTYRTALLAGDLSDERLLTAQLDEAVGRLSAQRDQLTRYAAIVDSTDAAIIAVSLDGAILDWNNGAQHLYGYGRDEALGAPLTMLAAPESRGLYDAAMASAAEDGHASVESVDVRRNGSRVHTSISISNVCDHTAAVTGMVAISRDISDRKEVEEQARVAARELEAQAREMERLALHDPVTGLGNRALLRERAIATGMRPHNTALLLLDLDGFKEVNDSLGHHAGDALLLEVGQRIGGCVRTRDTVVRLGGDEFAILLPDSGSTAAAATAERILGRLREPFVLDGTAVEVHGSIGVTLGTQGSDLDEMLRNADLAMYEAKAGGRDQAQVFRPAMYQRAVQRLQNTTDLRAALIRGEFTVYYQPIVSAASGTVLSLEALVRWDHPQRGVVPPFEFVPDAERNGLIVELGRFVLLTACKQVSEWRRDWPTLSVAVNVSERELLHPDFASNVVHVLTTTGLSADALHLEITETVLAADNDITCALESLAALGVEFSIDDFGTGHSSLSRLRTLPVDRLKIDKSFIAEITDDGTAPLLGSIIGLAHCLDRTVVAEGVETPEQATFLISNGCDELQGYLFGRPVAAPHVTPLLLGTRTPRHDSAAQPATAFPPFVESLLQPTRSLDTVLPGLLAELSAISGLQTVFVTEVRHDPPTQITRFAHNADPTQMRIEEGLSVDWDQTLCRRMVDDEVVVDSDVRTRYSDVEVAGTLGIETYVSIPVRDSRGVLRGTLCAASNEQVAVRNTAIGLMQLFARVLGERIVGDAAPPYATVPEVSESSVGDPH